RGRRRNRALQFSDSDVDRAAGANRTDGRMRDATPAQRTGRTSSSSESLSQAKGYAPFVPRAAGTVKEKASATTHYACAVAKRTRRTKRRAPYHLHTIPRFVTEKNRLAGSRSDHGWWPCV